MSPVGSSSKGRSRNNRSCKSGSRNNSSNDSGVSSKGKVVGEEIDIVELTEVEAETV